ncbi:MAG: DNA gyrase subunit A [Gammaproteobacteria bacterium]|nr:DNA gyrase subunit A [Gammaproteobacteria bacterium]
MNIEDEVHNSYLGYAMSVIIGRALPEVRDGLKPAHRRSLWGMHNMGNTPDRPHVKAARVSGEVMGKFHPHGDQSIYETIVRMAQDFNMRYPLVDGHGNFGSIDGDTPAAPRYTESRMSRFAQELLRDINEETVDFVPNYDETEQMPVVLPTRVPNLLLNGSYGIAVAMATNMPPHNLGEVLDACILLVDNPAATVLDLMEHIKGPDFPTGAIINGRAGIRSAYLTGRGRIVMRSQARIETDKSGRETIIVSEIPYQVNKARLIKGIAELSKAREVEGISELRDESDKDGIRIVMEIKRGDSGEYVLNQLFARSKLQTALSYNSVALVRGEPKTLDLKEILEEFLMHRREVISRRTTYRLRRARERGHIVEGNAVALANIDEIVMLIRNSSDRQAAEAALLGRDVENFNGWSAPSIEALLVAADRDLLRPDDLEPDYGFRDVTISVDGTEVQAQRYFLSPTQAEAILDMRLHRLTGLRQQELISEYEEILKNIRDLIDILASDQRVSDIIKEELEEIRGKYSDDRRTEIIAAQDDLSERDIIQPREVVVTISHVGYAKRQDVEEYRTQNRGGHGRRGSGVKESDYIDQVFITNTHDTLMCFTDLGRIYWLDAFRIPESAHGTLGKPIVNLINLQPDERISYYLPLSQVKDFEGQYLFFATERGVIKRTQLSAFKHQRKIGLNAINLDEGDRLIGVEVTDGTKDIMLIQSSGLAIRFKESDLRVTGRTARGVRGMRLRGESKVLALIIADDSAQLLLATEKGIGKRTNVSNFPVRNRGNLGVRCIILTEKSGSLVSALQVHESDDVMVITDDGMLIRARVNDVSVTGRSSQGVKLMNVQDDRSVVAVTRIADANGEEGDDEEESTNTDEEPS